MTMDFLFYLMRPRYAMALVFGLVALLLILLIWRMVSRWHAAPRAVDNFDFHDLFMENGKASKGAMVMNGAFVATTWFFIYYALLGKMSEGYFAIYVGAWIAPVVARMITNAPTTPESKSATATTTTETTLTTK